MELASLYLTFCKLGTIDRRILLQSPIDGTSKYPVTIPRPIRYEISSKHIFQKSRHNFEIPDARRVKRSKLRNEDPQNVGTTAENLVAASIYCSYTFRLRFSSPQQFTFIYIYICKAFLYCTNTVSLLSPDHYEITRYCITCVRIATLHIK